MDWTIYWFMFPVSICIATTAMLSGIGGAALFTPVFIIVFPLAEDRNTRWPPRRRRSGRRWRPSAFGFASGLVGYCRRGLIDFRAAVPFIAVAAPVAIIGALFAHRIDRSWIEATYAALMLVLFFVLLGDRGSVEGAPGGAQDGR